ncbi:putative Late embryoproteinsis abundant hydroxyproline-rich glycoprotein family [Hibiscus syriacus]|uniref:Late embryoproteinsis abundant hydroxyproline-rich glycoprotein family n=1 Tax=Hibiscus syriacus TaxID=106335 RepID=A0A6A3AP10_HIBSY|nr:late embryogenesis abundant protein At1g64065-like [Hibiscus syriacus]KAE8706361.1 putative Late embryoproteinsis abundant hydroxyproline-rich glycoprotein family [Hibiscus syriacus]
MTEDHKAKSLAPVEDYPRSDEKSSKCLVYMLAIMVIQGSLLLVFATIFLRPQTPRFDIGSVAVRNFKYGTNSSAPSFNLTLVTQVAVENTNFFGDFRFENSNGSVWCGSEVVGQMKIPKGRAQARAIERMNVPIDVSSLGLSDTNRLSSNISSGLLELNSYVKLSGKMNIMKIMKRRRNPELNCIMTLNLTGKAVQDLKCY